MGVNRDAGIQELKTLPRVGNTVASMLWRIGIHSIKDLRYQNAERLYDEYNGLIGKTTNRAFLYIIRCGIYVSCTEKGLRDKEKLQWFYWNDLKNPKCINELEIIQNTVV
ncbi:helix-hairpin-helix domain-containing protein [uncultured Aquimarina sp.]|uniref:helix-hairpin-helix domain-containing protein n=1 Tax=uncultured Aquimarina sp. TaxID=575652 RepID=UPI0026186B45|nr:helix-hairpin-helix domain-containing protein [uncultured Aquimarina sp.]